MRWYYTPQLGEDLSKGFETFVKHDDSVDEHLDSLLKTIMDHEKQTGAKIDAQIVTWRGCLTKVRYIYIYIYLREFVNECETRLTACRSWRALLTIGMGL